MNFDNYIFRSHMVGNIISLPKPLTEKQKETLSAYRDRINGKGKPLTEKQVADWHSLENKLNESKNFKLNEGAKQILTELVSYEKHGRKHTINNKYFRKGNDAEKEARDLLGRVLGTFLTKDDERKVNEWVTGKRDIKHSDLIIDIKSAYNLPSFNKHLVESMSDVYMWQLDSYMELWKVKEAILAFVLVDTPFYLIEDDLRRYTYQNGIMDLSITDDADVVKDVKEIVSGHIFTREALDKFCQQSANIMIEWFDDFVEIPEHERVHLIHHSFDPVRIEQRNECIRLARDYMNSVKVVNNITIKSLLI